MDSSFSHRITAVVCCYLTALTPILSMSGCAEPANPDGGNPDGGGDTARVAVDLQMNLDPVDPEVAILTGKVKGDKLVLLGNKDADGSVTGLTSLTYFAQATDEEPEFNLVLDEQGRPTILVDASGENARFEYDEPNNAMVVTYESVAGEREVTTVDLSADPDAAAKIFGSSPQNPSTARVRVDVPNRTEVILVRVRLVEVPVDAPDDPAREIGIASDGIVTASAFNTSNNIPPAGFSPGDGNYQFAVASRVADIEFLVNDCESKVGTLGDLTVAFQVTFALFLTLCSASTAGACGLVGAKVATLGGIGATVGSDQLVKDADLTCQDLRHAAAVGGTGRVVLLVKAQINRLGYESSQNVEYNLLDPNDPITQASVADVTFRVPVSDCGGCDDPPVCDRGQCVECVTKEHCPDGMFCSESQTCAGCLTADNCKNSSGGPVCEGGVCIGCTTDLQCVIAGIGSACEDGECVECDDDQDCFDAFGKFSCENGECFLCSTDDHCQNSGLGVACRDHDCIDCLTNADCDVLGDERCDPVNFECVPDEGTPSGLNILTYVNTSCDVLNPGAIPGECGGVNGLPLDPALAEIQLTGSPNRPTISWNRIPGVTALLVTSGPTALYGMNGRTEPDEDGDTDDAPFMFQSAVYGSYNLPNIEPANGVGGPLEPSNAVDLAPGQLYSITAFTIDGKIASLNLQINP